MDKEGCWGLADLNELAAELGAEIVIVGDVEDGAGVAGEGGFELFDAGEVEVRGGFVEDDEVGVVD